MAQLGPAVSAHHLWLALSGRNFLRNPVSRTHHAPRLAPHKPEHWAGAVSPSPSVTNLIPIHLTIIRVRCMSQVFVSVALPQGFLREHNSTLLELGRPAWTKWQRNAWVGPGLVQWASWAGPA